MINSIRGPRGVCYDDVTVRVSHPTLGNVMPRPNARNRTAVDGVIRAGATDFGDAPLNSKLNVSLATADK